MDGVGSDGAAITDVQFNFVWLEPSRVRLKAPSVSPGRVKFRSYVRGRPIADLCSMYFSHLTVQQSRVQSTHSPCRAIDSQSPKSRLRVDR